MPVLARRGLFPTISMATSAGVIVVVVRRSGHLRHRSHCRCSGSAASAKLAYARSDVLLATWQFTLESADVKLSNKR